MRRIPERRTRHVPRGQRRPVAVPGAAQSEQMVRGRHRQPRRRLRETDGTRRVHQSGVVRGLDRQSNRCANTQMRIHTFVIV